MTLLDHDFSEHKEEPLDWNEKLAFAVHYIIGFIHSQNTVAPYPIRLYIDDLNFITFSPKRSFLRSLIPWRWAGRWHTLKCNVKINEKEWQEFKAIVKF